MRRPDKRLVIEGDRLHTIMEDVEHALNRRIGQHGDLSFISTHEIFGVLAEEVHELEHEIRSNDAPKIYNELMDVAIAAIWGLVSLDALDEYLNSPEEW